MIEREKAIQPKVIIEFINKLSKNDSIKSWLQLFRAQSAPLTVIIVIAAYLHGKQYNLPFTIFLSILLLFIHYISYGHNSLMDTVMDYDTHDPAKKHHPLITRAISLNSGHKVIHGSLIILAITIIIVTILFAENTILGLISIIIFIVTGQAYNDGMSKESLLAAPIFSIMTCSIVAWGWFLSHSSLDTVGILYLIYIFLLMMFLDSWDGCLKDIQMPEKSNILVRLGVKITTKQIRVKRMFNPGYVSRMADYIIVPKKAQYYALILKMSSLYIVFLIMFLQINNPLDQSLALAWIVPIFLISAFFWSELIRDREWNHKDDLKAMSFEQIFAIILPIPLIAPPVLAILLIVSGMIYFWGMNRFIWESTFHPRV